MSRLFYLHTPRKKVLDSLSSMQYNSSMVKIIFKHWKTGEHLCEVGTVEHDNPQSDRLVLRRTGDKKLIDIIKSTIVVKEQLL